MSHALQYYTCCHVMTARYRWSYLRVRSCAVDYGVDRVTLLPRSHGAR